MPILITRIPAKMIAEPFHNLASGVCIDRKSATIGERQVQLAKNLEFPHDSCQPGAFFVFSMGRIEDANADDYRLSPRYCAVA